ncbi:hypothetical protein HK096_011230 [Nowakowskiella sp. JEL0078]|nr:hypothetical protein HK096_011230 [Nowakowskiella sp. JEL0078]
MIGKFVDARLLAKTDRESMIKICESLLEDPDCDNGVRTGDIYGLMIESNFSHGFHDKAAELVKKMKVKLGHKVNLDYYVDAQILSVLQKEREIDQISVSPELGIDEEIYIDDS